MTSETLVVVGGGLAAARAVEAMTDAGGDAHVVVVSEERDLPYDRPPLSKAVLAGTEESAELHPREWYAERGVELRLGVRAETLDPIAHTLGLADGTVLAWDRLLLATGSSVRRLEVPGADLANVLYLRTRAQSQALRDRLRLGGPVAIVGAGWIGLEVAAAARGHGCEVTMVEPQETPLQTVLGAEVGQYFRDLHARHGVRFRLGEGVRRLLGETAVTGLVTTSGDEIVADTVVVGVGITPNTRLAEDAGLLVDDGIVCDQAMRTSSPDIFAAGDVASWYNPLLRQRVRVDHWDNAREGGHLAGRAMVGDDVTYGALPYFFSDQYDVGLEYVGHVPRGTRTSVVLRGEPADDRFMAFWLSDDRVVAGMHVNQWETIDDLRVLVRERTVVDPRALAMVDRPLVETT